MGRFTWFGYVLHIVAILIIGVVLIDAGLTQLTILTIVPFYLQQISWLLVAVICEIAALNYKK